MADAPVFSDEHNAQAAVQAAIADAYDEWVEELEADPPAPTMDPKGPSEYPQYAYLLDATPEQQDKLTKAVRSAIDATTAG